MNSRRRSAEDACNDAFAASAYLNRSRSWKNLYNPENRWLQCRDAEGNWRPFTKSWADWDEASYMIYYWMVPYNLKGIIDIMGGSQFKPYTLGVKLNGQNLDRAWLEMDQIKYGGTLEYKSSSKPGKWATATTPPSFE